MATELEEEIGPEIVQRNGRGVPSIRESSSQADTADLQAAKKQQLLELLASLLRRGRITPEEIAGSVGRSLPPGPLEQLEAARAGHGSADPGQLPVDGFFEALGFDLGHNYSI